MVGAVFAVGGAAGAAADAAAARRGRRAARTRVCARQPCQLHRHTLRHGGQTVSGEEHHQLQTECDFIPEKL